MSTLVIYYSYTGHTKSIAENMAKADSSDLLEVNEIATRSKLGTYFFGSFAAMRQKSVELQQFDADFSSYDKIVIAMPIWAGYPAPAINSIIDLLPSGKEIELIMVSGSGNSSGSENKTKALIEARGCSVVKYQDIKG